MNFYIVYFAGPTFTLEQNSYDFEYKVIASDEEDAKRNAISQFSLENPELKLSDFIVGFFETNKANGN